MYQNRPCACVSTTSLQKSGASLHVYHVNKSVLNLVCFTHIQYLSPIVPVTLYSESFIKTWMQNDTWRMLTLEENVQGHKWHRRKNITCCREEKKGLVLPGRISQGRWVLKKTWIPVLGGQYLDRQISKLYNVNSCLETIDRLHPVPPPLNSFQ